MHNTGPIPDLVAVVMALGAKASEERLLRAWRIACNELGASPGEIAAFTSFTATSFDRPPTPNDFAVWLRERRARDRAERLGSPGRMVHAYDADGCEWVVPAEMVDGVRFISDEEHRRRRPWRT